MKGWVQIQIHNIHLQYCKAYFLWINFVVNPETFIQDPGPDSKS
jgi:hypothetical protein